MVFFVFMNMFVMKSDLKDYFNHNAFHIMNVLIIRASVV